MTSTYDFLGAEAISHLNSIKGIIGHLEEKTQSGDEDARRVLESLKVAPPLARILIPSVVERATLARR